MMKKTTRSRMDDKGFTLVEMIVVLVIIAVLASAIVPSLTGYINRANKEKAVSETRSLVMAAQTVISDAYANGSLDAILEQEAPGDTEVIAEIRELAGFPQGEQDNTRHFVATVSGTGEIVKLEYLYADEEVCVYDGQNATYSAGEAPSDNMDAGTDAILAAEAG